MTALALPSEDPIGIDVASASGTWIESRSGTPYMDLISGVAVSPLGHQHPNVLAAIQEQLHRHLHVMVYGEYRQQVQEDLAKKLTSLLPSSLDQAFLLNSGAEANEAAFKLAKAHTGRPKAFFFSGAYHGSTHGSLSLSDHEERKRAFRPLLPGIERLPFDDEKALERIDEQTAAVFFESVQGDAGVRIPEHSFVKALRER
ncbi:MAG: aspartate aminotransferase family protein, partial [Flavobacteriales bacterium]